MSCSCDIWPRQSSRSLVSNSDFDHAQHSNGLPGKSWSIIASACWPLSSMRGQDSSHKSTSVPPSRITASRCSLLTAGHFADVALLFPPMRRLPGAQDGISHCVFYLCARNAATALNNFQFQEGDDLSGGRASEGAGQLDIATNERLRRHAGARRVSLERMGGICGSWLSLFRRPLFSRFQGRADRASGEFAQSSAPVEFGKRLHVHIIFAGNGYELDPASLGPSPKCHIADPPVTADRLSGPKPSGRHHVDLRFYRFHAQSLVRIREHVNINS